MLDIFAWKITAAINYQDTELIFFLSTHQLINDQVLSKRLTMVILCVLYVYCADCIYAKLWYFARGVCVCAYDSDYIHVFHGLVLECMFKHRHVGWCVCSFSAETN